MPKLTEQYVSEAFFSLPKGRKADVRRDTSQHSPKGFALKILPSGYRAFTLRRMMKNGKNKVWTLPYPEFSLSEARELAHQIANEVMLGGSPNPIYNAALQGRSTATLEDAKKLLDAHREDMSDSTKTNDRATWKRIAKVLPMDCPLNSYSEGYVRVCLDQIDATSIQVQAQGLLKKAWGLAIKANLATSNPADTLGYTHKSKARRGYLNTEELGRLALVLEKEDPTVRDALLLILYLGLRRSEAASLAWEDINFLNGHIDFENHKTSYTGGKSLPLNGPAADILKARRWSMGVPMEGSVFPGLTGTSLYTSWYRLRKVAGLTHSLHDLRRTFAVEARRLGVSMEENSVLLGHSNTSITERHYAHPTMDAHREPSNRVARSLEGFLAVRN